MKEFYGAVAASGPGMERHARAADHAGAEHRAEPEGHPGAGGLERAGGGDHAEAERRAEAESRANVAAELLAAMSAVRRTARRATRSTWSTDRLPVAQSELLRLVAAQPGVSVAEAAGELRLAPNTVSTLVGRLAAAGLLERGRVLADGRSVRLSVTVKAQRRLASYRDLRVELTRSAMARMVPEDIGALADAIPALRRLAGQLARL